MPQTRSRAEVLASLLVPASLAVVLFLLLYILFLSHLWGDQAFLMYAAKQMLAGVRLDGPQLVETNPPMVVWFSLLPMMIAQHLHMLPDYALWGVLLLMLVVSTLWSYRLLRLSNLRISPVIMAALIGAIEFAIRPALFGQKEQIAVALLLPFVIAAGTEAKLPLAERIALGMCAGLGACFKPHQALVVVALECFLLVLRPSLRRLVRPEILALVVTGLVYFFCVWHFTPYLSSVVPILTDTYWALGDHTFLQLLRHQAAPVTAGLIVVVCALIFLRKRINITLPGAFAACSVGATLAFYVQHTGWTYQAFPATAFLALAISALALELIAARLERPLVYAKPPVLAWVAAIAVALVAFGGTAFFAHRASARAHEVTLDSELEAMPEGTSVYVFSIEMAQFRVLLDHNLVWGSRFAHLWMMPAIVQNEYPRKDTSRPFKALGVKRTEELASNEREKAAQDIDRWKPQYVFVQKCDGPFTCDIYNHPINFVVWFSQSANFAKQWSSYRYEKTVGKFDLYARR